MTTTDSADMCRAVAFEAVTHRRVGANPSELWAVLDRVADVRPRVVLDIGSAPGLLWCWWMVAQRVVAVGQDAKAVRDGFGGFAAPRSVALADGGWRDEEMPDKVASLVGPDGADVLVLGGSHLGTGATTENECRAAFAAYAPLVRDGGLVLVEGIASPATPGIAQFWRGLGGPVKRLVGPTNPIGYGVVEIHGKDRQSHG